MRRSLESPKSVIPRVRLRDRAVGSNKLAGICPPRWDGPGIAASETGGQWSSCSHHWWRGPSPVDERTSLLKAVSERERSNDGRGFCGSTALRKVDVPDFRSSFIGKGISQMRCFVPSTVPIRIRITSILCGQDSNHNKHDWKKRESKNIRAPPPFPLVGGCALLLLHFEPLIDFMLSNSQPNIQIIHSYLFRSMPSCADFLIMISEIRIGA